MATILEFGARLTRSSFTEKTEVLSDSYPGRNATDSRDDGSQSKFFTLWPGTTSENHDLTLYSLTHFHNQTSDQEETTSDSSRVM